jgi:hypothetical protein
MVLCLTSPVIRCTPPGIPPRFFSRRRFENCFPILMKIRHSTMHGAHGDKQRGDNDVAYFYTQ